MNKRVYFTDGVHEIKLYENEQPPIGYYKGRIKSCVTTKGKVWINNGEIAKFIDRDEALPEGFVYGRLKCHLNSVKQSLSIKAKKYKHYNNGEKEIVISENDSVPIGYVKGRLKMSDEQKQKLSESHKGLKHSLETKIKISQNSNNNRTKARKTICNTYGSLDEYYKYISTKSEETKKKNNTFNTSSPENDMYILLCEQYGYSFVKRNYKCEKYPFRCDFYISSVDKFIELNAHWTHGGRPYDPNDEFCQQQLAEWQEKAKTSKFYQAAIETWTIRDVKKQKVAKENNLDIEFIY